MFTIFFALLHSTAQGSVIIGNPTSSIVWVQGPSVWVHSVEAHRCSSGTQTLTVAETVDEKNEPVLVFDEDHFCGMDVLLKWDPEDSVETVPVDGFTVFKSVLGAQTLEIAIDATNETATLQ